MTIGLLAVEAIEDAEEHLLLSEYIEGKDDAKKTGEYDELHDNIETKVEAAKEATGDDAETTDAVTQDTAPDTNADAPAADADTPEGDVAQTNADTPSDAAEPAKDNADAPEEDKKDKDDEKDEDDPDESKDMDGKRTTEATESLRNVYYDRLILEAITFDDVKQVTGKTFGLMADVSITALQLLKSFTDVAVQLGINHGPWVLQKLKRGTLYLFTKSAKLVLGLAVAVSTFIQRHSRSIKKSQSDILRLKASLASMTSTPGTAPKASTICTDEKLLPWLSCGGKTDPAMSLQTMSRFLSTTIEHIDTAIMRDLTIVKKLIETTEKGIRGSLVGFMSVSPFPSGFLKRNVYNGQGETEALDFYRYGSALPDNLLFMANLPKPGQSDIVEISRAYQLASLYITPDPVPKPVAESVNYMDAQTLGRFLDALQALCALSLSHQSLYERVGKQANELKFGYRHYYQTLVESKEAKSVRESLVEYVHLKQGFVSKVYVPAAMDIHDYVSAYLVRAIRFAKANLKALS